MVSFMLSLLCPPKEMASSNDQLGGWVEQKAGLDVLEN
jgi:hypothetical protein